MADHNEDDVQHQMRDDNDPIFQFTIDEVPVKLREAEDLCVQLDFDTAIGILCNALTLYAGKYGELSLECAAIFKEYGAAMLEKAKSVSTAFGSAPGAAEDAGSDAEGSSSEDESESEEASSSSSSNDAQRSADDIQDLELAVENLEVARSIYEKHISEQTNPKQTNIYDKPAETTESTSVDASSASANSTDAVGPQSTLAVSASDLNVFGMQGPLPLEKVQLYLGDVYETLGDAAMEMENWDRALSDLSRSLEIREKVEKCDGRALASVHTKLAMYYSITNVPSKAIYHYNLAASVFTNRMATKMREVHTHTTKLNEQMAEPTFGLSTGSRPFALEINRPTAAAIEASISETTSLINKCIGNIADYADIRKAILEKIQDCEDEIKSGIVSEEGDNGEKVRKMIKEVMRTEPASAPVDGFGTTTDGFDNSNSSGDAGTTTFGFGSSSSSSSSSSSVAAATVNVLTVKRKKPTAEPVTTTSAATVDDEEEEEHKKSRMI